MGLSGYLYSVLAGISLSIVDTVISNILVNKALDVNISGKLRGVVIVLKLYLRIALVSLSFYLMRMTKQINIKVAITAFVIGFSYILLLNIRKLYHQHIRLGELK